MHIGTSILGNFYIFNKPREIFQSKYQYRIDNNKSR